jgi:hypothetical protein
MLRLLKFSVLALGVYLFAAMPLRAQGPVASPSLGSIAKGFLADSPQLPVPASLPRMAPDLALRTFQQHTAWQLSEPPSYSATTVVDAELPDTSQRGEYHLRRHFIAPRTLLFSPVKFEGDGFVKSNVIARLLQAEVDHVTKGDSRQTAINQANYKFSYRGSDTIDGTPVHVFQVKPRGKRPGLFKGRIYLDAGTGSLRRAEGTLVKTPSFFVKRIEFVQDYEDIDGYTLPIHTRSLARTRLVGRARVEVATQDYQLEPVATASSGLLSGASQ